MASTLRRLGRALVAYDFKAAPEALAALEKRLDDGGK